MLCNYMLALISGGYHTRQILYYFIYAVSDELNFNTVYIFARFGERICNKIDKQIHVYN